MIDTIIRFLYYSLFFVTPLIMASITSELFEFNKMLLIYAIAILVLFFWAIKMILLKRIILKKTLFDIPLLVFLGSQIVSTIFSIDTHTSLYGYYGRFNGGLFSIIAYIILYFGFTSNILGGINGFQIIQKILKTSLISSLLVILWGLPGKFGFDLSCFIFTGQFNNACWTDQFHPELRMFSTLGQPNWLGAYLAINFFIALYFLLKILFIPEYVPSSHEKKGYVKRIEKNTTLSEIFLYGYLFLNFSSILFTRSRSALVSVIGGLLLLGLFGIYFKNKISGVRIRVLKIILLFLLMLFPLIIFKSGFGTIDRYLNFSFPVRQELSQDKNPQQTGYKIAVTESFDIRKIVWKGAIDVANRFPLFGSGVETFAFAYYFVRPEAHNLTSEWDYLYNKAHNEYINYAATTGYIGLLTYLVMIIAFFILSLKQIIDRNAVEKLNSQYILIMCLVLAYISILITNFFGFSTTTINIFFYSIPAVVMILAHKKNEEENPPSNIAFSPTIMQWGSIGVAALVTLFLLISCVNYFLADVAYARADAYSKTGDYQSAARLLTQALKYRYEHVYEDKLSYVLANLAVAASYQKQPQLAQQIQTLSNNYNTKSIQASPKNVLYWKTRAKNQYLFYQIGLDRKTLEEGIRTLEEARKLSPTDPKIPYSLSIFKSLLYDDEKDSKQKKQYRQESIQDVENSVRLKPDFRDGYFLKAQLLKKYGEKNKAKETYEYILNTLNPADEEIKKELQSL